MVITISVPISQRGTGGTPVSAVLSKLGALSATRTINFKALNSNIELNCDDICAAS